MAQQQEYDERSIIHHEGLNGVRAKPTMYLGERGNNMVYNMLTEAVDNSYDEYAAGRNSEIEVIVDNKTGTYIVADKAGGIPVGTHKSGLSTLELVLTKLHAGGKFHDSAYKTSSGTHGVGIAAVNAVSTELEVWTVRDGVCWYQSYAKGVPQTNVIKQKIPRDILLCLSNKSMAGTIVRFIPDQSIVSIDKKERAVLDIKRTVVWLRDLATMNRGLKVTLHVGSKSKTWLNSKGIESVLTDMVKKENLETIVKPIVYDSGDLAFAVQWTSYSGDDGMQSYVSSKRTDEHGTHITEFYAAITAALEPYRNTKDKYSAKDLRSGLRGVLNIRLSQAEFSNQTKNKLVSPLNKVVLNQTLEVFKKFFAENKTAARKIIGRANDAKKLEEAYKKAMSSIKTINKSGKGSTLLATILNSANCKPSERELFMVEGDSAAGTAKKARDSSFQEVMRLSGKISNALRTPLPELLQSKTIQNILIASGYDHTNQDPINNLRVERFYFLSDADPDGSHINILLAALFYRLMPELYTQGRVYVCNAPLFSCFYKGTNYFGDTFNECYSQLPNGAPKTIITRAKGWGELNPEVLAIIAFSPQTRNVIQLKPVKGKEEQYFLALMGNDTAARKKLLGV